MERRPLDLRDEDEVRTRYTLPRRTAFAAAALLIISGIAIGTLLPELVESEEAREGDPYSTPLSVLLTSTIDLVDINGTQYTDVQIPIAYFILMNEKVLEMTEVDGKVSEYISFMLENGKEFQLTISTGQGWDAEISHKISVGDISTSPSSTTEQEVVVDMQDGGEITLIFKLFIWEVASQ